MAETVLLLAIKKIGIALANEVTEQAGAQFAKHLVQLTELQGSMGRIMRELRVMHDFLCQMDIRNRRNQVYQGWLEEVRKVVYVMEDMVDEYLYLVGRQRHDLGCCSYLKRAFRQPRSLFFLDRIASMVKETEKDLEHLSKTKDRWIPMINSSDTSNSSYNIVQRPEDLASISRTLDEDDLVGVEDNKHKLFQWLEDEQDLARSVIVVHGMGGLGKTALAATVYRKQQEKFDCHAWVSISQTYTREDVLRRLVVELFRGQQKAISNIDTMDMTAIHDTLKGFLEEKKYLIVLDDVWTPEVYNDLFGALITNLKGSKIIITTRNADLAHLSSQERALELKRLSDGDSWKLFCKKAFLTHECPTKLQDLAEQMVRKCEGLPLAIVSIGSLLFVRDKTREEWKRIHDQLSWELINNPRMGHVRNVLHLSFIYLPTQLKGCFLYCSLFPEDHLLKRKKLVRWWIAEGFVERKGGSTMEEVAEGYITELVQRNLLQLVERNSFGRIKSLRMHDIVYELAVDLSRRECFGISYSDEEDKYDGRSLEQGEAARRLVIHTLKKDTTAHAILSAHGSLRSVVALDMSRMPSSPSTLLLHLVIEKCRYISVLELNDLPIDKVPEAIGDLFNLRHLGLRGSKVKLLPKSIEKLSNLLTLDLYESEIQELPSGIVKLKKLRHLFVERVSDIYGRDFRSCTGVRIPKGLENLTDLQTLQSLEVQDESVKHLGELKQMRSLRICDVNRIQCEHLSQSLRQMDFLSFLSINTSDEDTVLQLDGMINSLPPNLRELHLKGRLEEAGMQHGAAAESSPLFQTAAASPMLYSLDLSWSHLAKDPLPSLSQFSPNLTVLRLTRAYIGEQLVFLQGWFPNLKNLTLRDMPDLKRLEIQQGAMASLEELQLANLSGMAEIPTGIEFLVPTLKSLSFVEITWDYLSKLRQCPTIGGVRWWHRLR